MEDRPYYGGEDQEKEEEIKINKGLHLQEHIFPCSDVRNDSFSIGYESGGWLEGSLLDNNLGREAQGDEDENNNLQPFATLRRELLQAIHRHDLNRLSELLASASPEDAGSAIDDLDEEDEYTRLFWGPVTPLAVAIRNGEETIIRLLVERSVPRSFTTAIAFEATQIQRLQDELDYYNGPDWGVARCEDPTTIALHALLHTQGKGENIFAILHAHSFDLTHAQYCDAGRTIWFWAARNNFVSVLLLYLEAGFPIDLVAPMSSFTPRIKSPFFNEDKEIDVAPEGTKALWNAAWKGASQAVDVLLQSGAVPSSKAGTNSGHVRNQFNQDPNVSPDYPEPDELLAASQGYAFATLANLPSDSLKYSSVLHSLLQYGSNASIAATRQPRGMYKDYIVVPIIPAVCQFAELGCVTAVQYLFDYNADIHVSCGQGKSLLHYAVRSGSIEMLKLALGRDAPIDRKDSLGYYPIHDCVLHGTVEALTLLIERGADVNALTNVSLSALIMAISMRDIQMTRILLENGANPNHNCDFGAFEIDVDFGDGMMMKAFIAGTPLLSALYHHRGSPDVFKLLLDHGANPTMSGCVATRKEKRNGKRPSSDQETSWSWYIQYVDPCRYACNIIALQRSDVSTLVDVLVILLDASKKSHVDGQLPKPYLDDCLRDICVSNLSPDWSQNFRDSGSIWRPPFRALDVLLDLGANPNVRGSDGITAAHLCCSRDGYSMHEHEDAPMVEGAIRKLVALGADINATDHFRRTPLHYAVVHAPSVVDTLIALGADVYATDSYQRSALVYACSSNTYHIRIPSAQLLLSRLDENFIGTYIDWDPVVAAIFRDNSYWSNKDEVDAYISLVKEIIERAESYKRNTLCKMDSHGNTPIHRACTAYNLSLLRAACQGKRIWQVFCIQNQSGRTPLILSALSGSQCLEAVLQGIMHSIHSDRTYVNFKMPENFFPSHRQYSQVPNDPRLDILYTELGATISLDKKEGETIPTREARAQCLNMCDAYGWTAIHYAAQFGDTESLRLLLEQPGLDIGPAKRTGEVPTPMELALGSDNADCVRLLRDAIRERKSWSRGEDEVGFKVVSVQQEKTESKQSWRLVGVSAFAQRIEVRIFVLFCALLWMYLR
jgi:ankyrin repeat protein